MATTIAEAVVSFGDIPSRSIRILQLGAKRGAPFGQSHLLEGGRRMAEPTGFCPPKPRRRAATLCRPPDRRRSDTGLFCAALGIPQSLPRGNLRVMAAPVRCVLPGPLRRSQRPILPIITPILNGPFRWVTVVVRPSACPPATSCVGPPRTFP
jgi:hypothetical protein